MPPIPRTSWRTTAITAALGALLGAAHLDASALALGRLTTLSALGEPLRAEIDIPQIDAAEFASLKATLATPEDFKAAGMEYSAALASAQLTLHRRANGSAFLQVRSDKAVPDPFVNLVITAKWASGQIVRNYTLLLDPPAARQIEAPASAITAPITFAPAPKPVPVPVPVIANAPAAQAVASPSVEATNSAPRIQKPPVTPTPETPAKNRGEPLKVASGDTAGKIAAQNKPVNVSLDQMLVAMLRGNPQAFIGNNINRLKTGAILSLPTSEEAQAIPASVAHQNMIAQSKDFNNFRRKLAENAPGIVSKAPDRQAGGKVEAKVEERKTAVPAPDKLTLSKANLNGDAQASSRDPSEKIAKEKQAKDDAARVAELSKNISDLNKIASSAVAGSALPAKASPPAALVPGTPPAAPGTAAAAPGALAVTAAVTPPAPAASAPAPATAAAVPAVPVVPVVPVTPAKPVKAPPAPIPEPGFINNLMDSAAVLPAAGGLLALLLAGGMYVRKQRKARAVVEEDEDFDTEFADQSFFNTTNHTPDALADLPAASVTQVPASLAVPEPSFAPPPAPVAPTATPTVPAVAPADTHASANAHAIKAPVPLDDAFPAVAISEFSARTVAQLHPESAKSPAPVDLDLDFDFDVSGFQHKVPAAAVAAPAATLDFDIAPGMPPTPVAVPERGAVPVPTPVAAAAPVISSEPHRSGMIEFDLDSLSLDLNATNHPVGPAHGADHTGPLETKLALAQEFRAIGDAAGAKMLAQEVIALASGSLKIKAENLLTEIG